MKTKIGIACYSTIAFCLVGVGSAQTTTKKNDLSAVLRNPNLFNTNVTESLITLARTSPNVFADEVIVGEGKFHVKLGEGGDNSMAAMVRGMFVGAAVIKAIEPKAGKKASAPTIEADGVVLCVPAVLKTNLFVPDVSDGKIHNSLGPPSGRKIIPWSNFELNESSFVPSLKRVGEPDTVALYFDGAIGVSKKYLWINGPQFLAKLGLQSSDAASSQDPDERLAVELAEAVDAATSKNDAAAQYKLAGMFASGRGVAQNHKTAASWYQKAAEQNHVEAAYNLAVLFEYGLGVPKDREKAVHYFRIASDGGHADAKEKLRELAPD
jgi:hypothetical protein